MHALHTDALSNEAKKLHSDLDSFLWHLRVTARRTAVDTLSSIIERHCLQTIALQHLLAEIQREPTDEEAYQERRARDEASARWNEMANNMAQQVLADAHEAGQDTRIR
jgi:hypothetical protein